MRFKFQNNTDDGKQWLCEPVQRSEEEIVNLKLNLFS